MAFRFRSKCGEPWPLGWNRGKRSAGGLGLAEERSMAKDPGARSTRLIALAGALSETASAMLQLEPLEQAAREKKADFEERGWK